MKINKIIKLSIKNLKKNKKKNSILLIPLIIMLVILFLINIIQYSIDKYINKIGETIELRTISGIEYAPSMYQQIKEEIEQIDHVEWVYNQKEERIFCKSYCEQFSDETKNGFIAIYPATENVFPEIINGRGINSDDEYVAIIPSKIYADTILRTADNPINEEEYLDGNDFLGKEITINNEDNSIIKKFKVIGIYNNEKNNQNNNIYIPAKIVKKINEELKYEPGYYRLNVVVDNISNLEYVEQQMQNKNLVEINDISTKLNESGYNKNDELSRNIASVTSITIESQNIIKNTMIGLLIFATVIFIVILIATNFNKTYLLNVEIGLLKIEGYTDRDIQRIAIIENVLICIISAIIALIITAIIVVLFDIVINNIIAKDIVGISANKIREQLYNIQKIDKKINPLYVLGVSAAIIVIESFNTYFINKRILSKDINKILKGDL